MTITSSDYEVQDERTRAQIRVALDETLFVEAGAGTGKTRALVERVVALVLGGRAVERIAAITFTEKAAAELKDRVRGEFESARATVDGEAKGLIDEALKSLDRAAISTIHSFGQSLLRSFAAEAGVDPAFVVQDEVLAERRLQERWRGYLETLAADAAAVTAIDRVLGLGLTTGELEKLARELTSHAHLIDSLSTRPPAAEAPVWPDLEELHLQVAAIPLGGVPLDDKLRPKIEKLLALIVTLCRVGDERESVLAEGAAILEQKYGVGSQDNWGGRDAIGRARDVASAVSSQLDDTLMACRAEALRDIMPLVVRFVAEDAEARGREGALSFDDLILRPRDLLKENTGAARVLRDRYQALLVDEFQDTDPLQVDIALAFATDPDSGAVEAGRLFLVGDPKQSIYRFRRADMAIYAGTRELVERQGGEFPQLALCQRARPEILEWVNSIFATLIGEGDDPAVQPQYQPIHAVRSADLAGPGVAWIGGQMDAGVTAREARQVEATQVASQCRAVIDEGWQVQDRDKSVRPARFKDIAILIPTRAILPPLERSLAAAGIPYRVEGGSLIYRTQEVRDLINCLTAIDDPCDEVAVVGALRSTAFACSDVDLARHKAGGGSFDYLAKSLADCSGPVADGLNSLAGYHHARHKSSLAALVERFVAERRPVEVGILDQGGRNSFRRMRFVVEQARGFEAAGPESLRGFVSWLERRASDQILDREGAGLDDDEDAVKVLTIHGAKGLEFPIVFVAGLSAAPRHVAPVYGVDPDSGQVAVTIGTKNRAAQFKLGPADEVCELETRHGEAEFDRLLYVACTRPKDHLLVFLHHSARAPKNCGTLRLIRVGACDPARERPQLPPLERTMTEPFGELHVEPPDEELIADFGGVRLALIERSRRQRYTSATALGPQKKEETRDETEPWARGRGGTDLGRAVHATLQSVSLDADDAIIEAFARAQAVAEAIPQRANEVARLVRRALSSEAAQRARAAQRALREVPFAVTFDGTVLEGFIDLLIETSDGIEIVDWKTDGVSVADVPGRLSEYRHQAGLYVLGIETAVGRPVSSVTYVFAAAGVEASPGEPSVLAAQARALLDAAAQV